jgi:hypothetical protein
MRTNITLARLSLWLCFASGAVVFAQGGKDAPPPAVAPTQARNTDPAPAPCDPKSPICAVEYARAPQGWMRYEIQFGVGRVVSVVLPSQPTVETKSVPMGTLPAATLHQLTIPTDANIYVLQYMEGLPVEVTDDRETQNLMFQKFWSGFVEGFRSALTQKGVAPELTLQPPREMTISGSRVQSQDFAVGDAAAGCARAVVTGGHLYAIVVASRGKKLSAEGAAFLDSFALSQKR